MDWLLLLRITSLNQVRWYTKCTALTSGVCFERRPAQDSAVIWVDFEFDRVEINH